MDFLAAAGQRYWQILPLLPDTVILLISLFSTFAGNPYFINLERLAAEGLLTEEECESFDFGRIRNRSTMKKKCKKPF